MPDFRVADTAPEHPKLRAAGLAAAGLWSLAGGYAMRELTDGWVPEYWVTSWPGAKRHAATLVSVGLWDAETRSGIPGYRFKDWLDYQRPAAKIHEERAKGKERAARSRARAAARDGERNPDVRAESHDSLPRALTLPPGGSVGGERPEPNAAASRNARPPRCPEHAKLPPDQRIPSCGRCKALRLAAEQQAADQAGREAAERAARRDLIDRCPDCDDAGMREFVGLGVGRCTHPALVEAAS